MKLLNTALLTGISLMAMQTGAAAESMQNRFVQHNLVANKPVYKADTVDEKLINAWGIAIRPAGAGGHFWVTGKDISFQYVGDVRQSTDEKLHALHTDDIPYIQLPVGNDEAFATSVVFSNSADNFIITQNVKDAGDITAPAKFIFVSDGGVVSAWTERKKEDGSFDRPLEAKAMIDQSADGAQFFGAALSHDYDTLYVADFGAAPAIKVFDGAFKPAAITFEMPFDTNKNGRVDPGEFAPFNVQALRTPGGENRIFVTYAMTQGCPAEEVANKTCEAGALFVGEEYTEEPGQGRLAEFTEEGKLVSIWNDGGKLSAPWGLAFAPAEYGPLSNNLLLANFGDGTISAYDPKTRGFTDYLRDERGEKIVIDKIWGLMFGNGASLGDSDALYFTAGPEDETDGLFGSLRVAL